MYQINYIPAGEIIKELVKFYKGLTLKVHKGKLLIKTTIVNFVLKVKLKVKLEVKLEANLEANLETNLGHKSEANLEDIDERTPG